MLPNRLIAVVAIVLTTLSAAAAVRYYGERLNRSAPSSPARLQEQKVTRTAVSDWPKKPRSLAEMMLERYGPPDWSTSDALIWRDKKPWKRIIVHKNRPAAPLEQVVNYHVSPYKISALLSLKNGIKMEAWYDDLSARSDRESLNFLALNLADDIAQGRRTPEQARQFHGVAVALSAAGKSSPYLDGLLFLPHHHDAPSWESPVYNLK